ncbi:MULTISPECIES: hypothetical protein [unclassified Brevundimonas]|uniref:hypothetical protein n=1 Tax=unclassified Brevundimonas TaxID=2622653 RepID=UPI0025C0E271|nr:MULTISPECIES: hypothetical protein [unclassified Brevundimonas]
MGWLGNAFGSDVLRVGLVGLTLAAAAGASPAAAHTSLPGNVSNSLRIKVVGEVAPSCALSQTVHEDEFDVLDDATGGSRDASIYLPFAVDCNAAFDMKLSSLNGSLDFKGVSAATAAFRRSIAYSAEVRLPGGVGGVMSCGSAAMERRGGCKTAIATDDVVQGAGSIKVSVARDGQPLLRGIYSDTLTLTLQPRLGGGERD